MKKNPIYILVVLPVILALAGCANIQLPWAKTTTTQNQQNQAMNMANQPVESKLALGTLSLEGTSNAVTADQAKTLLPLWKAVKSLGSNTNTTTNELTALYNQIQSAMTPAQVQAIKDTNLSQTDLQALMQKYSIQLPQGAPGGQSASPSGTQTANRTNSGSTAGGAGGGFPGGPGGDPGGLGGPPPNAGGAAPSGNGQATVKGTPQVGGPRGGGMNLMLVDPLIKLLEQRAGA